MPIFTQGVGVSNSSPTSPSSSSLPPSSPSPFLSSSSPPDTPLPFTIALLISEGLFTDISSPVATLIIPFIRIDIPYGYWIIVLMEFTTALLLKWSYGPSYSTSLLNLLNSNTALPDLDTYKQFRSLSPGGTTAPGPAQSTIDTPLFPSGMTFNISFSVPFSAPESKLATLFTIELKEIKNIPRYVLPVASLVLYFLLESNSKRKKAQKETAQSN